MATSRDISESRGGRRRPTLRYYGGNHPLHPSARRVRRENEGGQRMHGNEQQPAMNSAPSDDPRPPMHKTDRARVKSKCTTRTKISVVVWAAVGVTSAAAWAGLAPGASRAQPVASRVQLEPVGSAGADPFTTPSGTLSAAWAPATRAPTTGAITTAARAGHPRHPCRTDGGPAVAAEARATGY
jgi:hypothetical protein